MLLAFDLDKTILTQNYELPDKIKEAIFRARNAGHYITVLTGRPKAAALPYLEALELKGYYSTNHGALVVGAEDSILQQKRLSPDEIRGVLDLLREHELVFSSILDDVLYVEDPGHERWDWAHTLNRQVERFDPDAYLAADKLVFRTNGQRNQLAEQVSAHYPQFTLYRWDEGYLEVTAAEADKGTGLALLAEALGVSQQETIAFGDGPNDVTMLAWAQRGIAVGPSAHPDVLAVAESHIAAPEDLGVAAWLEQNLL